MCDRPWETMTDADFEAMLARSVPDTPPETEFPSSLSLSEHPAARTASAIQTYFLNWFIYLYLYLRLFLLTISSSVLSSLAPGSGARPAARKVLHAYYQNLNRPASFSPFLLPPEYRAIASGVAERASMNR